ncbi:hypothetical protein EJ06DRAFT_550186 [Trichodelitschia bisporula]|uniref:Uncharacterized protein n=1 Tax=Trichodelitschia bisporula TaxID=703511 RepID=A0A6G1HSP7_9PEZI|nr:hypothetical protein EJ06DRAFT_550186 [Trichodelitschia bisporula]
MVSEVVYTPSCLLSIMHLRSGAMKMCIVKRVKYACYHPEWEATNRREKAELPFTHPDHAVLCEGGIEESGDRCAVCLRHRAMLLVLLVLINISLTWYFEILPLPQSTGIAIPCSNWNCPDLQHEDALHGGVPAIDRAHSERTDEDSYVSQSKMPNTKIGITRTHYACHHSTLIITPPDSWDSMALGDRQVTRHHVFNDDKCPACKAGVEEASKQETLDRKVSKQKVFDQKSDYKGSIHGSADPKASDHKDSDDKPSDHEPSEHEPSEHEATEHKPSDHEPSDEWVNKNCGTETKKNDESHPE